MQSSILGVAVCGCVSDAGVESSNVHAAPVCGGVGRCVCESHVAFISISSVQCVLHFYFIDGEGGGGSFIYKQHNSTRICFTVRGIFTVRVLFLLCGLATVALCIMWRLPLSMELP